ncbi:class IV lanthionine synthetase LanL [Kribbella sp. NPDC004536]|uniref:class IV lanthionine synthetase LanL n=1 Tax=Kribbella sp. NPDC004536 TaxID=3364106 RepID=UPI0036979573
MDVTENMSGEDRNLPRPRGVAEADSLLLIDVVRAVLARRDGQRWVVRPEEAWCYLTPPVNIMRRHGWKIHVSATPLSAPIVLARAAEVLIRRECSFKFGTDLQRVAQLCSNWYDRGGAGKFITVYPRDDDEFRVLTKELHEATTGLLGPQILSDRQLCAGSLVHFRYGEFSSERVFTDDGVFESRMVGPDGSEVKDERLAWFSPPSWAVSPFPDEALQVPVAPESVLLDGRFRVREAIRHANKGGVYRATDETTGLDVIVKQARRHIGAGLDGSDACDRLREEGRLLDALSELAIVPAKVAVFEQESDLFLVEEFIPGSSLRDWSAERTSLGGATKTEAAWLSRGLVAAVREVHEAGYVLQDLKPQNVIVTPFDELRFIDVEYVVEQHHEGRIAMTLGFAAPEVVELHNRRVRSTPDPLSDCFSLGVTLFCALTGMAPTWVAGIAGSPRPRAERERILAQIANNVPVLSSYLEVIVGLTEAHREDRWPLSRAEAAIATAASRSVVSVVTPAHLETEQAVMLPGGVDRLLDDGIAELIHRMTPHDRLLWPMIARVAGEQDPCSAWAGSAGALLTLSQAAGFRADNELHDAVARSAKWIGDRLTSVPRLLPGMAFGRGGTAYALHAAARVMSDDLLAVRAVEIAKKLPIDSPSPDFTHGLSGAGIAHLRLWEATQDPDLAARAVKYADAVLSAKQRRGPDWHWPISAGLNSRLAGSSVYGFAHGIAGVGAFMAAAATAAQGESDPAADRFMEAAIGAGDTLCRAARIDGDVVSWPTSVDSDVYGTSGQWCNGPTGIGSFLIDLWSLSGERRHADLAERCAATALSEAWVMPVGACCGLAGVGQFLVQMSERTGDRAFRDSAEIVADLIAAQAVRKDGIRFAGQQATDFSYAQGLAGVLSFLVRLRHGGAMPWM